MRLSLPSPPTLFPSYLMPSLPFRRKSSTNSNISTSSTSSTSTTVSTTPPTYLAGHASSLRCSRCSADLALTSQIISKGFTGRHGRAYLVAPPASPSPSTPPPTTRYGKTSRNLPNTYTHKPVSRSLVTGNHTVSDISCAQCGSVLGWKYVAAEEEAQRYKVGNFILETKRVCRSACWEGGDGDAFDWRGPVVGAGGGGGGRDSGAQEVEFDSQDEDDCKDLFLGLWTPQVAAKRRRQRGFARKDHG